MTTPASVLAVDDNATIRRAIAMRLSSKGYHVVTAEDGAQALAALDEQVFDLMLLDLQMPGMHGDEVLRHVRERYSSSELPVIMLAASDDSGVIERALALGANDYIVKPGELPVLLARIRSQLSRRDAQHQAEAHVEPAASVATSTWDPDTTLPTGDQRQPPRSLDDTSTFRSDFLLDKRYGLLYDHTPMTCFTLNRNFDIVFANRFGVQALGYLAYDLQDQPAINFYAEADHALALEYLQGVLDQPERIHRWEIRRRKRNGDELWMRETARLLGSGEDALILMTCEDINDTYTLADKLAYHAAHDELTGVSNRKHLEERLSRVLESAQLEHSQHALALFDIDQFKIINDTSGYVAGDELLKGVARLLRTVVRRRDIVARMGADEFAVLFEDYALEDARARVEAMREALLDFKFEWDGRVHNISTSVGLVGIDEHCESVTAALGMADAACYAAKDAGRNRSHVYDSEDAGVAARRGQMRWVTRINDALRDGRFELMAQAITPITPRPNAGRHCELLLRMRDEQGNLILPGEFLPAAERYNLAVEIDRWVVRHTLDWLHARPEALEGLELCGINLSGQAFGDEMLLGFLLEALDRQPHGITSKLCFEVTETNAISDLLHAQRFITALRSRGCRFAIDDFGSGFSSFAYLKNLPVDYVKIDGSFVRGMARDPIDLAMVRSINEIGHVMGKQTIAEFVEDEAILEALRELGVDYAQGHAIARPVPMQLFLGRA
jgi:diguanylate cyclase (GGDEF)-like protein/PAS domain S-box-containing protein